MSDSALITIKIENISKRFGPVPALSDISLTLNKGQIYALVGPNGAGKTTLLKLITGLLTPTKGRIYINGYDIEKSPVAAKQQFAYIPDDPKAYDYLTGEEFLFLTGNLRQLSESTIHSRIKELLPLFPLADIIKTRMSQYSRGNKQKLAFLAGLLAKPEIFLIDEPIVGLDPDSIKTLGKTLQEFAKSGGTVLFSTHILDFAKQYASHVGFLSRGKLVRETDIKAGTVIDKLYQQYANSS